jgi:uncharacterized phiE125 gp8 family phage protein
VIASLFLLLFGGVSVSAPSTSWTATSSIATTAPAGGATAPGTAFTVTTSIATTPATGTGASIAPTVSWGISTSLATTTATGGASAPNSPFSVSTAWTVTAPTGTATVASPSWINTTSAAFPAPVIIAPIAPTDHSPITLAQAKAFLKVENAVDDALIGDLIDAAANYCEVTHGIVVAPRSQTFTFDAFADRLPILRNPVRGVTSVTYTDATGAQQTLAPTQWQARVHNGLTVVQPAYNVTWPTLEMIDGAVTVTADIGWTSNGAVPATIRLAAQKLVTAWYQVRDAADPPADVDRMLYAYRPGTL